MEQTGKSVVLDGSRRQGHDGGLHISSLSSHPEHLLLPCTVTHSQKTISSQTLAFIDCGATAEFCDTTYALSLQLPTYPVPPQQLTVADGQPSSAGLVTHATDLTIDLNGHKELQTFYLTDLGRYQIILGKPWLTKHNPSIDWVTDTLTFDKPLCLNYAPPSVTLVSVSQHKP